MNQNPQHCKAVAKVEAKAGAEAGVVLLAQIKDIQHDLKLFELMVFISPEQAARAGAAGAGDMDDGIAGLCALKFL